MSHPPSSVRTVVVGAGIVGLSIAAELAARGTTVTVVEAGSVAGGTTSTSYAWVNANGKEPDSYYRINAAGLQAHRSIAGAGGDWIVRTGHLEIAADPAHERDLRHRVERLIARGYTVEELDRQQTQAREPGLIIPADSRLIVRFADESYVHPMLYVAEMLTRLRRSGGTIHEHSPVTGVERRSNGIRVTTANGVVHEADRAVLATGRWTSDIARLCGVEVPMVTYTAPGDVTVGHLVRTHPIPTTLSGLVTTPWLNARPDGGGRLMIQALDLDATAAPDSSPDSRHELIPQYLARLRSVLRGTEDARVDEIIVGQRAMPADGKTIAGPVPDAGELYVVATHSGVTLAPFLGRSVADEILGTPEPLLEDFRLTRFADGVPGAPPRGPRKPGEQ